MTLYGWDMSHYDAPDIGDAVAEGYSFFTHKAGGDVDDPELAAWWSNVKNIPPETAMLGAYWVLYPGSPVTRADKFVARLDAQCPGWRDRPFILQVDCEQWRGDSTTVPPKSDIRAFCDRLVQRMPKLRPIVYAPKWTYGNTLTGLPYPLWASSYVTGTGYASQLYPGDNSARWGAYSGQEPAVLQFTSSATIAGQTTCDANAFRGTLTDLQALLAPGWETPMTTLDSADHSAIRNDTFLGAGADVAAAFMRATSGDPATASGTDRAIRNGWAALVSFGIETEHKEVMAKLAEMTAGSTVDNAITAVNSARDSAVAEVQNAITAAVLDIKAAVSVVPDAVFAKLQDPAVTDAEVAAVLTELLGSRKAAILALM